MLLRHNRLSRLLEGSNTVWSLRSVIYFTSSPLNLACYLILTFPSLLHWSSCCRIRRRRRLLFDYHDVAYVECLSVVVRLGFFDGLPHR